MEYVRILLGNTHKTHAEFCGIVSPIEFYA
jgi:hypothetical protein